jgi:hypothetical protein
MSVNNTVRCPSFAQPMRLIQRTRRFGELPENLCTFECRACGVSLLEDTGRQREPYLRLENLHGCRIENKPLQGELWFVKNLNVDH